MEIPIKKSTREIVKKVSSSVIYESLGQVEIKASEIIIDNVESERKNKDTFLSPSKTS